MHVGENDGEAGYLYGEVCATKHRLWLSFTCIREAGCQCPLDLEDGAAPPLPAIEHLSLPGASSRQPLHASQIPEVWTPGSQPSLTTAPSAFAQWKDRRLIMTLAASILLLHDERHVCVRDKDGQPLGVFTPLRVHIAKAVPASLQKATVVHKQIAKGAGKAKKRGRSE